MKEQTLISRQFTDEEILKIFGVNPKKEEFYSISYDWNNKVTLKTEVLNE